METTPLAKAIETYIAQDWARCHTPGHKGVLAGPLEQAAPWDVTEIRGLDSLFQPQGPIVQLEERYTALYRTAGSLLSAGGSTLGIQAMLALVRPLGKRILLTRNIHHSAVNAMALLGLEPLWLYPDQSSGEGFPGTVSPQAVEKALEESDSVAAVYITSPDYFGVISDIAGLAEVCHRRGIPLCVDNAHGAHLSFGAENLHPIPMGADICCDSLHKTLPVLTGGALLHLGNSRFLPEAKAAMGLFGSTSPSYLVMLSADQLLPWLEGEGPAALQQTATKVAILRKQAEERGFAIPCGPHSDPTRLVLGHGALGVDMQEFDALLTAYKIEPEYQGGQACVFLFSPHNREEDYTRLAQLIAACPRRAEPLPPTASLPPHPSACSLREAVLAPQETIPTAQAIGRIMAATVSQCPPGIPLLVPGERVDEFTENYLLQAGISTLTVVK